ncbi:MAG: hypothetical protein J6I96_06000 [Oscillospiraceae bacterium]|nr:hypothetical protein [Oscillospiraceae bacterium]
MKTKMIVCLMLALALFTACGSNKVDYEAYKTDIIGVWCDVDGPEYIPTADPETAFYYIIEFTDDNTMATHESSQKYPGYVLRVPYELRDDILVLGDDGQGRIRIGFEDGNLLITDGQGTHTYRHPTVEELGNAGVYPIDEELYQQVLQYMQEKEASENTQTEKAE